MASAVKPASDSPLLPLEPFQIKDVPSEEDSYIILSYGTSADGFTICIHPEGGDPTKWPTHIRRFSVNTASLPAETEPTPEPEETPQSDFSPKGAVWL